MGATRMPALPQRAASGGPANSAPGAGTVEDRCLTLGRYC